MSLQVIHEEKVICDICHKPIQASPFGGLFGTRFTMTEGIFGKQKHADICDDCQQRIIEIANKKGETK